jgi:hypothetical protein
MISKPLKIPTIARPLTFWAPQLCSLLPAISLKVLPEAIDGLRKIKITTGLTEFDKTYRGQLNSIKERSESNKAHLYKL